MASIAQGGSGITGLAFNAEGQLFAASSRDSRVLAVEDGNLLDFASTGGYPQGLAIDARGTVLVADAAHGAVLELAEDGSTIVMLREFERVPLRVRLASRREPPVALALARSWRRNTKARPGPATFNARNPSPPRAGPAQPRL
jgi:hypothetical protein